MLELTGVSGEEIKIEKAEGKLAWRLYSKLLSECLKNDIDITNAFDEIFNKVKDSSKKGGIENLLKEDIPSSLIDKLLQIFMIVASSEEIRDLFIKCVQRSLYGNNRITEEILDNNPEDYNLIFFACIKQNVLPFFLGIKGLASNILGKGN